MGEHYSKAELELYRNRQMSVLGRIACSAHLEGCPACAGVLKELEAEDRFLRDLRMSVKIYGGVSKKEPRTVE